MSNSYLANPGTTIEVLKSFGLHTKKSFGQNFLVDDGVIGRILSLAEVSESDTILEVGPGIGTLTVALLAKGARVISVEMDRELLQVLDATCPRAASDISNQFALLNMDATNLSEDHVKKVMEGFGADAMPSKFVANLPYAVAATLVLDYFQRFDWLESACVMVQSEVALRMCAEPRTKDYAAYSVKIQLLTNAVSNFLVKPGSFMPPPRVDSRVIRLDRRTDIANEELVKAACLMADAAFFQRRKTVSNSMKAFFSNRGMDTGLVPDLLMEADIDPKSRGEVHPIDKYLELGDAYLRLS